MAKEISDVINIPSVIEQSVKIDKDKFLEFMLHKCDFNKHEGMYEASMPTYFEYVYSPTAAGTTLSLHCRCGRKDDITDYSDW